MSNYELAKAALDLLMEGFALGQVSGEELAMAINRVTIEMILA